MNVKRHMTDALIGAFAAVLFMTPIAYYYSEMPYTPYQHVSVDQFDRVNNEVRIEATFLKNGKCTFSSLRVFSGTLGKWRALDWYDRDKTSGDIERDEDKSAGWHTIRINVLLPWGDGADELEVRTRHLCGPDQEKTDKILLNEELKP